MVVALDGIWRHQDPASPELGPTAGLASLQAMLSTVHPRT